MPDTGADLHSLSIERLFPRVHSRALGGAVGITAAGALFLITVFHVVVRPNTFPIGLLGQYFYGYSETWTGAAVGAAWGLATGFAGGWLLGFMHNTTVDLWLVFVRARADLTQRRNILDELRGSGHE